MNGIVRGCGLLAQRSRAVRWVREHAGGCLSHGSAEARSAAGLTIAVLTAQRGAPAVSETLSGDRASNRRL